MIPDIYEFDPGIHIREVLLVGVGGTGAQIARLLARLLYDMRDRQLSAPSVALFDPDTVEARNIGRQLFTPADVGQNKAEVVARRLNLALGLNLIAVPHAFTADDVHHSVYGRHTLLIGAVDNAAARSQMAQSVHHSCVWIDCGNHEHGGQVVIGAKESANPDDYKPHQPYTDCLKPPRANVYRDLPAPHIVFPDLLKPDPEPLSCADLAAQNRQALFVNDWMALAAINYAQKLLLRQPIHTFITYIDAQSGNVRSIPLTAANLRAALKRS